MMPEPAVVVLQPAEARAGISSGRVATAVNSKAANGANAVTGGSRCYFRASQMLEPVWWCCDRHGGECWNQHPVVLQPAGAEAGTSRRRCDRRQILLGAADGGGFFCWDWGNGRCCDRRHAMLQPQPVMLQPHRPCPAISQAISEVLQSGDVGVQRAIAVVLGARGRVRPR